MSGKPIFVATHPRSCSTAFERVFMTRRDTLQCAHEPFGDCFYYGPERLSDRYDDESSRVKSGFSQTTYQDVLDRLEKDGSEGKGVFIKDMAYYLMPPNGETAKPVQSVSNKKLNGAVNGSTNGAKHIKGTTNGEVDGTKHINGITNGVVNGTKRIIGTAKCLPNGTTNGSVNGTKHINGTKTNGIAKPQNPTVLPLDVLKKFHWTFLIRHPRRSIPSFYRCTVPPLDKVTGFSDFDQSEAGYAELRILFDYLREQNLVGPHMAGETNECSKSEVRITLIDADDLLDHPQEVIEAFCKETGIEFNPEMLCWDSDEDQRHVEEAFSKWIGFHNDAINSTCLSARTKAHKVISEDAEDQEWREKYGEEGQKIIRRCVNENVPHYEYLKQFVLKV